MALDGGSVDAIVKADEFDPLFTEIGDQVL